MRRLAPPIEDAAPAADLESAAGAAARPRPTNEELITKWDEVLRILGASDRVRWRKVGHVETFAYYLVTDATLSSTHLLDAGESEFNRFFFWKYIRRFPNSRSDAESFTRDLRDFYKHQACLGRLRDASFAELFYHMRKLIGERIELYDLLLVVARIDRPGGVRGGACVTGSAERPVHLVAWPSSSSPVYTIIPETTWQLLYPHSLFTCLRVHSGVIA